MIFKGWQKTSLIEYPGKISTVLFTGGCNFRCPFCYNRDLVVNPEKLPDIRENDVLDFLNEKRNLYQAVMVTGGEPTMQSSLPEFFGKVKGLGLLAGLETNGTNPAMLKEIVDKRIVDFIAMDIKAPLVWEKYGRAAGIKDRELLENVKKSVKIIMGSGIDYEFRTTVVPGLHTEKDIADIARQLKGVRKLVLQQFIPKNTLDVNLAKAEPYPAEALFRMKRLAEKYVKSVEIRNV